jgi:hypothetical protein
MFVKRPLGLDTRLTRRSCPPRHGFIGPPRRATPRSARRAFPLAWADPARSPWRRCLSPISATDQLSRAPAGPLHSRAWGLRPSDRTLSAPSHRSPHRRAGDETEPSATAPVDRVNGFPASSGGGIGVPPPATLHGHLPPMGWLGFPELEPAPAFLAVREPRWPLR